MKMNKNALNNAIKQIKPVIISGKIRANKPVSLKKKDHSQIDSNLIKHPSHGMFYFHGKFSEEHRVYQEAVYSKLKDAAVVCPIRYQFYIKDTYGNNLPFQKNVYLILLNGFILEANQFLNYHLPLKHKFGMDEDYAPENIHYLGDINGLRHQYLEMLVNKKYISDFSFSKKKSDKKVRFSYSTDHMTKKLYTLMGHLKKEIEELKNQNILLESVDYSEKLE